MDNNLPNTQLDDQKMENLRKRTKLSKYIMIAGGVCLGIVVLMILLNGGTLSLNFKTPTGVVAIILIIGGFALLFTGLRVKQKAGEAQKHIANNYARSVLGRVMDRLDTFDHGKHIDRYYLNQDFGFPKYDCTGFCGDYVRGVLRGVPMEFCEFELQEKHVTEDKDGDTDVSYETVFYGVIVVCRHNLALSDAVMATQFKTYENAYNADSEAFYNAFSVRCTSEQDAKLALTPDYMQKLLELSAERGKRFAIRFLQDGTLLLVIKDMNLFEMGKSENTVQLVEKLEKEMEDFINILDTGSHPPIISREMYEQAQRLKESRFSETRRAPHTFTHRIQCPSCGRFYRHINSSGTSKWACPNQVNKVKDCPNYWISETTIKLGQYRTEK